MATIQTDDTTTRWADPREAAWLARAYAQDRQVWPPTIPVPDMSEEHQATVLDALMALEPGDTIRLAVGIDPDGHVVAGAGMGAIEASTRAVERLIGDMGYTSMRYTVDGTWTRYVYDARAEEVDWPASCEDFDDMDPDATAGAFEDEDEDEDDDFEDALADEAEEDEDLDQDDTDEGDLDGDEDLGDPHDPDSCADGFVYSAMLTITFEGEDPQATETGNGGEGGSDDNEEPADLPPPQPVGSNGAGRAPWSFVR